jgi:RNA polymerase sigma factor FliA
LAKPRSKTNTARTTKEEFLAYFAARDSLGPDAPDVRAMRDRICKTNMPLVGRQCGKMVKSRSIPETEMDDFIQAGATGLLQAIERYNPSIAMFSTYAVHWIRQALEKHLDSDMVIRRPRDSLMPWQTRKLEQEILIKTGRKATAEELEVAPRILEKWRQEDFQLRPERMDEGWELLATENQGDFGRKNTHDSSRDVRDSRPSACDALEGEEMRVMLAQAIERLPEVQRKVLEAHYGEEEVSLRKLAKEMNRHEESVRLIRVAALAAVKADILDQMDDEE